jgi:hypothetical protein
MKLTVLSEGSNEVAQTEFFGDFFDQQGNCDFSSGFDVRMANLPYARDMWIRVEGFDASQTRMICLGRSDLFSKEQIEAGSSVTVTLEREQVQNGDLMQYALGTIVVQSFEGLDLLPDEAVISYNLNPTSGDLTNKINGVLVRDPEKPWIDNKLIFSNLLPYENNNLLLVARSTDASLLGQWRNADFDIGSADTFVEVFLTKEE